MWNPLQFFMRRTTESRASQSQSVVTRAVSGITVTSENALKSSAVYAAIRYHAQTVGQLPWYAYKKRPKGGQDELSTDQFAGINNVLMGRTNPRMNMSSQRFREIMVTHALLYGNGVAEVDRDATGRAKALYPLRPDRLSFETPGGEDLEYVYQDERRGTVRFRPDDVFHISNFGGSMDMPAVGKSVIEYAAESIGWNRATELFGAAYFSNGIHPSVLITMKNSLSPEAYRIFNEELHRKFGGHDGQHRPFVTDGEVTVERLSVQPDESQFVQSLQHQIDDIARWIGVPPSKIGHMIHAGVRANVEHASIEVVQDYVMPWVMRFEQEANAKLFRTNERYFTRMDLSALLRGDHQARAEYYTRMLVNGVFSVNEVRQMEDWNPVEHGDQHLVQGQYRPLSQAGAELQPPTPQPAGEPSGNGQKSSEGPAAGEPAAEKLSAEKAGRPVGGIVHLRGN
jgi:HK97 family phage portal protein